MKKSKKEKQMKKKRSISSFPKKNSFLCQTTLRAHEKTNAQMLPSSTSSSRPLPSCPVPTTSTSKKILEKKRRKTYKKSKNVPKTSSSQQEGYLPGTMLSAEQILEVPIDRRAFKPTSEECPFCVNAVVKENGSKCIGVCRNPQNVPGPLFFPHQMQTCRDAVEIQLEAMKDKNNPRTDHGVQVMWEYSVESGNMDRSRYFGFSSDMYHFDHFLGKCLVNFEAFVFNAKHEIVDEISMKDGRTLVKAIVTDKVGNDSFWGFVMVKRTFSKYKGCWQSLRILPCDENWDSKYIDANTGDPKMPGI